jgi:peptidoglycan hydrolase-like protein with peptidoglycan-binding domain
MTRRVARHHDDVDLMPTDSIWRRIFGRRPFETLVLFFVLVAVATVAINALYGQPRAHPAPMFATARPVAQVLDTEIITGSVAKPAVARPAQTARSRADIVLDIQRELQKRGYYAGALDGLDGPRTDAAIRDAEQALGLRQSGEPTEALLTALPRLTARTAVAAPARDSINAVLDGQNRTLAVQRALADYGYGPLRASGTFGPETKVAIERFERDRRLPVTGQMSERLVRELSAVTGRPLE